MPDPEGHNRQYGDHQPRSKKNLESMVFRRLLSADEHRRCYCYHYRKKHVSGGGKAIPVVYAEPLPLLFCLSCLGAWDACPEMFQSS